jgi:hypothetical protein
MNWEVADGSGRCLILRYFPRSCLEKERKTTKTLGHNSRSPGQVLNAGHREFKAGVLITRPQRLLLCYLDLMWTFGVLIIAI